MQQARMLGRSGKDVASMCFYGCCFKRGLTPKSKNAKRIKRRIQRAREKTSLKKIDRDY